jgi:hypothetical protein
MDIISYSAIQRLKRSLYTISFEAGEDLHLGAPVIVRGNKFYLADHAVDPIIVGVIKKPVSSGLLGIAAIKGVVQMEGLVPAAPYFVGYKEITTNAPSFGYSTRIGSALTETQLLINIEEPIFLN